MKNESPWSMQWSVCLTPELAMIPDSSIFVRQSSLKQETESPAEENSAVLSYQNNAAKLSSADFVAMLKKDSL